MDMTPVLTYRPRPTQSREPESRLRLALGSREQDGKKLSDAPFYFVLFLSPISRRLMLAPSVHGAGYLLVSQEELGDRPGGGRVSHNVSVFGSI